MGIFFKNGSLQNWVFVAILYAAAALVAWQSPTIIGLIGVHWSAIIVVATLFPLVTDNNRIKLITLEYDSWGILYSLIAGIGVGLFLGIIWKGALYIFAAPA